MAEVDATPKETAKYAFPDETVLEVEPDGNILKSLEYKCVSTGVTVKDAYAMKMCVQGKIHEKKLEKLGLSEDPSILALLERFMELEKPHRDKKRAEAEEKQNEYQARMAELKEKKETMSKEEYKQWQKERRAEHRFKIINGEEEPKPKRQKREQPDDGDDKTPYKCGLTGKILRGYHEVKAHLQSDEFAEKAAEYEEGCALCGFKSDDKEEVLQHYMSMAHFKRLHHLAYYGMDVSNWYIGQ